MDASPFPLSCWSPLVALVLARLHLRRSVEARARAGGAGHARRGAAVRLVPIERGPRSPPTTCMRIAPGLQRTVRGRLCLAREIHCVALALDEVEVGLGVALSPPRQGSHAAMSHATRIVYAHGRGHAGMPAGCRGGKAWEAPGDGLGRVGVVLVVWVREVVHPPPEVRPPVRVLHLHSALLAHSAEDRPVDKQLPRRRLALRPAAPRLSRLTFLCTLSRTAQQPCTLNSVLGIGVARAHVSWSTSE
jgi:hypothetical protein